MIYNLTFENNFLIKIFPFKPNFQKYADVVQSNLSDRRGRGLLSHEVDALALLWEDAGIQQAYDNRSSINMNDSVRYFFNSIDRFADQDFVPTVEDLIMLYIPTVGKQY